VRTRSEEQEPEEQPVVRDRRRIDPVTGAVREPQPAAAPAAPGTGAGSDQVADAGAGVAELEAALAERTADLQRLQAEYVNYKRRVDRDRGVVRETALANVLSALLPVLDDIARAREHGELDGGFKAVADSLERTLEGLGLEQYGRPGDPFDPRIHEALMHGFSDAVSGPTCQTVVQAGYRLGERVIRPARVGVVEPAEQPAGDLASQPAEQPPVESVEAVDSSVPDDAKLRTASESA
jgi:molecular chaperone GrpE